MTGGTSKNGPPVEKCYQRTAGAVFIDDFTVQSNLALTAGFPVPGQCEVKHLSGSELCKCLSAGIETSGKCLS